MAAFDELCASELAVHEWLLPRSSRRYTCMKPLGPICQFERDTVPAGNRILAIHLQAVISLSWNTERWRVTRGRHCGHLCELEEDDSVVRAWHSPGQSMLLCCGSPNAGQPSGQGNRVTRQERIPLAPLQFGSSSTWSTGKLTRELSLKGLSFLDL